MLRDNFGRTFSYLRLSLTSLCNFRCQYCLPNGNVFTPGCKSPLTGVEIQRLVQGFSELGVSKIRLTGGEAALRPDLVSIIDHISATPGVDQVALTTNGFVLERDVTIYRSAGVTSLNVSIDSLSEQGFEKITGHSGLRSVLRGLEKALLLPGWRVKVNTVLMKGLNDGEVDDFIDWVRERKLTVRFIELMPTADQPKFFTQHHFDLRPLRTRLLEQGWVSEEREKSAGPAEVFSHRDYMGRIGLIQPYSSDFCGGCNRLRVTSLGELRLCLFGSQNFSLRPYLQDDAQKEVLKETIVALLGQKEVSHFLNEDRYEGTRNFAAMGG